MPHLGRLPHDERPPCRSPSGWPRCFATALAPPRSVAGVAAKKEVADTDVGVNAPATIVSAGVVPPEDEPLNPLAVAIDTAVKYPVKSEVKASVPSASLRVYVLAAKFVFVNFDEKVFATFLSNIVESKKVFAPEFVCTLASTISPVPLTLQNGASVVPYEVKTSPAFPLANLVGVHATPP